MSSNYKELKRLINRETTGKLATYAHNPARNNYFRAFSEFKTNCS